MNRIKTVPCPTCGRDSEYSPANPHRPFCSERCRNVDLGQWASESYRIPVAEENLEELPDDEEGPPRH